MQQPPPHSGSAFFPRENACQKEPPLRAHHRVCPTHQPPFLIETVVERSTIHPNNCPPVQTFGPWSFSEPPSSLSLSGTVPYLSGNRNEQAKRTTGTFLQHLASCIMQRIDSNIVITVNNTPFKSLGRTLPIAKCSPPALLENYAVYRIAPADAPNVEWDKSGSDPRPTE